MNRTSKRVMAVGVPLAAIAASGIAFAAWTTTGGGSGAATALSAQPVTVAVATTTADLYPGFTAGKLYVTVTNPNPYPVTLTSISQGAGAVSVANAGTGGCAGSLFSFATSSISQSVAANGGTKTFSVAAVTLDHAAGDGCQGATATIPVTVTGAQD